MILVLGGVKSGKTSWAESTAAHWAEKNRGEVVYLASARAWDDEMKLRIKRHQQSRPEEWQTIEEPLDISGVLKRDDLNAKNIVIFDCLTLWLTNLLMDHGEDFTQEEAEDLVQLKMNELMRAVEEFPGEIIVISNLVEQGLVSPHFLGRIFQEIAGRCHQLLAGESEEVFHMIAGIPQRLK
ncbi:bifunctional adenosylcobinamide kinase/adenosylcobinamide-phosphate guanylyltransferase [Oceanispirochaeta sp.]|jgi:adenosylcobinamide kinase/adenosylcobinamide-phosphate guanylyltransferase|uniref:bifunctional adenosylcobinamide kinase/adenosylcobinamide-phosphate guanylyltransferase n=1 Tax=Oceanispirochaeta sp. TaxID=2035350 RepID=UPI0026152DC2|nr:bifunctional adenosylcobinamide kinase/adenosylcobinamide-phosphate guanylyltransferase [Oceanispirochaeta sp.]MDA3956757.1 bifunctional adenosylcobinamide kinase/adenosylcobinamide-phosphate guanylyltransferase [Oceanispirochaeta sp.]